jgi:hypothetical protein
MGKSSMIVGYGKILDDCHYVQSKLTLQEANMAGKSPKKKEVCPWENPWYKWGMNCPGRHV